ncbi:hypothetical protein MFIFM68171_08437 [Madurella fahalii]|uniref:Zn(2)-C6 fungal-type domain-containing protein n=1 Tax=Madurella fahalii TaxID=1157608 RepID=A0ABQ0GKD5_9PEZI
MFGTWRFDANPENDVLTTQVVDPATARPLVQQACQSCREKKIRCSGEKAGLGCSRCRTLSKPCVYAQRGENKRLSPRRRSEVSRQKQGQDAASLSHMKTTQQTKQKEPPKRQHEPPPAPPGPPALSPQPQQQQPEQRQLDADFVPVSHPTPSAMLLCATPGSRHGGDEGPARAVDSASPSIEYWLSDFAPGTPSQFDTAMLSPSWISAASTTAVVLAMAAPAPAPVPVPVPVPATAPPPPSPPPPPLPPPPTCTANITTVPGGGHGPPPSAECSCLQHVAFLVHELESATTGFFDAHLALHKEAVEFGHAMLRCVRCRFRPENLTLLTFLAERLLRLGEMVIERLSQTKDTPLVERQAVLFGEYEVDSSQEWELVVSSLLAVQLAALKKLMSHLKTSADAVQCELVYRKAAKTEERVTSLNTRVQASLEALKTL